MEQPLHSNRWCVLRVPMLLCCCWLRCCEPSGSYKFEDELWSNVHDSAKDMLARMMVVDPSQRWTARQLLQHPWFAVRPPSLATTSAGFPGHCWDHTQLEQPCDEMRAMTGPIPRLPGHKILVGGCRTAARIGASVQAGSGRVMLRW